MEDLGSIPELGRSPGEGKGYPLQYSGLENSNELYSPWGHKESNTAEQLHFHFQYTLKFKKTTQQLGIEEHYWNMY